MQLSLYIIKEGGGGGQRACEALTAPTVGMGDCQAAAKYTPGSVSGSSAALSELLTFSDKSAFCSLKSSDSCDRGEVGAGTPPVCVCVCVCVDLTDREMSRGPQTSALLSCPGAPLVF